MASALARDKDAALLNADDAPFYFNASHWRAIDGAVEALRADAGLVSIIGPAGSGKTTVMRAIADQGDDSLHLLTLPYANLGFVELVNFLASGFQATKASPGARNNAEALKRLVIERAIQGERFGLLIDEAQNLDAETLRMLPRLIAIGQTPDGRRVGLQFVLVGGEDLGRRLSEPANDAVRASVGASFQLRNFTRSEMEAFLKRRLAPIARVTREPITRDGIERMALYTGGNPRLLGMVCAHAMLFAAETPGRSIDGAMVEEAAKALMLEPKAGGLPPEEAQASGPHGGDSQSESLDLPDPPAASDGRDDDEDAWDQGERALRETRKRAGKSGAWTIPGKGGLEIVKRREGDSEEAPRPKKNAAKRRARTQTRGAWRGLMRAGFALAVVGLVATAGVTLWRPLSAFIVATLAPKTPEPAPPVQVGATPDSAPVIAMDGANAPKPAAPPKEMGVGGVLVNVGADALRGALDKVEGVVAESSQGSRLGGVVAEAARPVLGGIRQTIESGRAGESALDQARGYAAEGQRHFDEKRYIEPKGGNAYDSWRRALDLDPRNEAARDGVRKLVALYADLSSQARARKDWTTANALFARSLAMSELAPLP